MPYAITQSLLEATINFRQIDWTLTVNYTAAVPEPRVLPVLCGLLLATANYVSSESGA